MRLFIALPIPSSAKKRLGELHQPIEGVRWQQEGQIHLTLKFLGETDPERAQDLKNDLQNITMPAFDISIQGFGYFSQDKQPRVLWADIKKSAPLKNLQKAVELKCQELGFKAESRAFKPHITIARINGGANCDIMSFINQHKRFQISDIPIEEFVLYESKLNAEGAKHIRLKAFPLVN